MTMSMRQQMVQTVSEVLEDDEQLVLLLADVSYSSFVNEVHSERMINVGIMEQTMTSVGAGLALEGFIPVLHTITPFLVERPFEQIKDDFCYQGLGGNFISIGASYDYSIEGMTHHSPGDVQILKSLPGMQIVVPGTAGEFDRLFRETYANGSPTYFRLSVASNPVEYPVRFGKLEVVQQGKQATVIVVGPALSYTLPAVADLDVTVLYCTTVVPFDAETLRAKCQGQKIVLVEPYYAGGLTAEICAAMGRTPIAIESIGVPRTVLNHYGTPQQHDEAIGLTPERIHRRIEVFLNDG